MDEQNREKNKLETKTKMEEFLDIWGWLHLPSQELQYMLAFPVVDSAKI